MFRLILCRGGDSFNSHYAEFQGRLSIVSHQLVCYKSSNELLQACFDLVVSVPPLEPPQNYDVMTDYVCLASPDAAARVIGTIGPLLSVLPDINNGINNDLILRVFNFLIALIDIGSLHNHKLLMIDNLGESLLLTFYQTLFKDRFRSMPVPDLLANLARSLILLNESAAVTAFDIIYQIFLLCEHMQPNKQCTNNAGNNVIDFPTRNVPRYRAALQALGKVIVNCFVSLHKGLQEASVASLTKELNDWRGEEMKPSLKQQLLVDEGLKYSSVVDLSFMYVSAFY